MPTRIPILLDDLLCFCAAMAVAGVAALLGAWLGRLIRLRRVSWSPDWSSIARGAAVAAVLLTVGGVGALWWAGDDSVDIALLQNSGWFRRGPTTQGALGVMWVMIIAMAWVVLVSAIASGVALVSALLTPINTSGAHHFRLSLWKLLVLLLVTSVVLGLWIGDRRVAIDHERAACFTANGGCTTC